MITADDVRARFGQDIAIYGSKDDIPADAKGFWLVDDNQYYGDRSRVSNSSLEAFRKSITEYHDRYISCTASEKTTESLELGSLCHCAVFEPERFDRDYVICHEKWDLRTNIGKEAKKLFIEKHPGKEIIDAKQNDLVAEIQRSIKRDSLISSSLRTVGLVEVAIIWTDPETGLACRAKLDKLSRVGNKLKVIDGKTAPDCRIHTFSKACHTYGYHRQKAFYTNGLSILFPGYESEFLSLVIGKESPSECAMMEIDEKSTNLGRLQIQQAMDDLRHRMDYDNWTPRLANKVTKVSLPQYAFYEG